MTLFFNHLGRMGRLGNQMFQYSTLRGISKNRGFDFSFPIYGNMVDEMGNDVRTELFECFKMESVEDKNIGTLNSNNYVYERMHNFDESLYNECPDNVSLNGYFQTEKYFSNVEEELRKDFQFKDEIYGPCKEVFESLDSNNILSLHVRRSDYLINPDHHPLCAMKYYENALEKFCEFDKVIVFSDDTEWCKNQLFFSDDKFLISESKNNHIDLCLMSMCSGHIIANSSFSWWGAWLANSKKVISPKQWFGSALKGINTNDIYLREWIKL